MIQKLFALSLGFAGMIFVAQQASAQQMRQCAKRPDVVDRLNSVFGESRRGVGIAANNAVMEVFASEKTGTWTIVVTNAKGISCLVASGEAYETVEDLLPATDRDL